MERLKPYGVESSPVNGDVLTSVDGETVWQAPGGGGGGGGGGGPLAIDELTDVDTATTVPVVGQALVWDGFQWVPGDVTAASVGEPQVVGSSSSYAAAGPYPVALPDGVDETFPGKFVLIARWTTGGPAVTASGVAGIDVSWTQAAWDGDGSAGGPTTLVLVGDPREVVSLAVGTGPCSLLLLAVAEVGVLRGTPGERKVIDDCSTLTHWTAPYAGTTVTQIGPVDGDPHVVWTYAADDPYITAGARLDKMIDFTGHPTLEVTWAQRGGRSDIAITAYAVVGGVQTALTKLTETGSVGGPRITRFACPHGSVSALLFTAGKYDNVGGGYDFYVMEVAQLAPDYGTTVVGAGTAVEVSPGLPVTNNDLVIVAGAANTTGAALTPSETGMVFGLEISRAGDANLTIAAWSAPGVAGVLTPTVTAGAAATDLSAVVIAFGPYIGSGHGTPGGGLPDGATEGDVLTWEDGVAVWEAPALPPASTYLVPLTTVVAGEPMLMWTEDNQLIFVEETLPS